MPSPLRASDLARRLRVEGRDLIELILLPGLAALLPWRWCFALFRVLARWPWLYRESCQRALQGAKAAGMAGEDESDWLFERRLVTLVDHADHYLSRTRSDAWLRKHLRVEGEWAVQGQAALLVTFHWGCGMWAHRHARASGLHPHSLLGSPAAFAGRWVLGRYIRSRMQTLVQAEGRPVIVVPGNMRDIRRAWDASEQVTIAIDVPADQVATTETVRVLGRPVQVPAAMARWAVRERVPVVVYTLGLDLHDGHRDLKIRQLGVHEDAAGLLREIFVSLDEILGARPAAWHFWSEADRFFAQASTADPAS